MGRYSNSTATAFALLPCQHEGHHELAEHDDGLEITCTECGAKTWIPRRCECGLPVAQAKKAHEENWKLALAFPIFPGAEPVPGSGSLYGIEESLRIKGVPVVVTAKEMLEPKAKVAPRRRRRHG